MFPKKLALATLVVCLSSIPGPAAASPILTFNEGTGLSGSNQDQSVGWQFNVISALTVTGLGWFDEGADGLVTSHTVGIWDSAGVLLTSAVVPSGSVAGLDGQFRTALITPITLLPGAGYIVGGENFSRNTERLAFDVSFAANPAISFVDATFSNVGTGFTRPTSFSVASTGFFGPSFSADLAVETSPVPEPATFVMLGTGLALAGVLKRFKKRV